MLTIHRMFLVAMALGFVLLTGCAAPYQQGMNPYYLPPNAGTTTYSDIYVNQNGRRMRVGSRNASWLEQQREAARIEREQAAAMRARARARREEALAQREYLKSLRDLGIGIQHIRRGFDPNLLKRR